MREEPFHEFVATPQAALDGILDKTPCGLANRFPHVPGDGCLRAREESPDEVLETVAESPRGGLTMRSQQCPTESYGVRDVCVTPLIRAALERLGTFQLSAGGEPSLQWGGSQDGLGFLPVVLCCDDKAGMRGALPLKKRGGEFYEVAQCCNPGKGPPPPGALQGSRASLAPKPT